VQKAFIYVQNLVYVQSRAYKNIYKSIILRFYYGRSKNSNRDKERDMFPKNP